MFPGVFSNTALNCEVYLMFVSEPVDDSFGTKVDEFVHCVTFQRVTLLLIRGTFKDTKCLKQFLEIYSACS